MTLRWPWARKKPDVINTEEARRALAEAKRERAKVEAQQPQVDQLSSDLARHARENNFSKLFEEAMHLKRGSR